MRVATFETLVSGSMKSGTYVPTATEKNRLAYGRADAQWANDGNEPLIISATTKISTFIFRVQPRHRNHAIRWIPFEGLG